jgi:guanosine-3',5'-bis(diphosphate) 3'-pyrophosphohydrolase
VLEKFYQIPNTLELYFQIAKGKLDLSRIRELEVVAKNLVLPKKIEKTDQSSSLQNIITCVDSKKDTIIIGEDFKDIEYRLANCCTPIPGDDVFGFITATEGIKIHRVNCPNATRLMSNYAYRIIKATWKSKHLKERLAGIKITGIDDVGIVNTITNIISQEHRVNMKSISFESTDGIFEGKIMLYVYDTEHLDKLMLQFEQING